MQRLLGKAAPEPAAVRAVYAAGPRGRHAGQPALQGMALRMAVLARMGLTLSVSVQGQQGRAACRHSCLHVLRRRPSNGRAVHRSPLRLHWPEQRATEPQTQGGHPLERVQAPTAPAEANGTPESPATTAEDHPSRYAPSEVLEDGAVIYSMALLQAFSYEDVLAP